MHSGLPANGSSGQQFVESNPKCDKLSESHAEVPKFHDMTEIVAENKSSDYKETLAIGSIKTLTKDQSQLMELLR